ncbi:hypothetical protein [Emergencia sp.]|uniref:hypothetical protein n=1 Tax=Emergencia sp. TaxID=1926557 RepID=UPI003AF1E281
MDSFMELIKDQIKITEMLIDAYSKNIEPSLDGTLTYKLRYNQLQYYLLTSVKRRGIAERKQVYLGKVDSPQVQKYKNDRFYRESVKRLKHNLNTLKRTEKKYQDYSPEYIQKKLPNAYKDLPERCFSDPIYEELCSLIENKRNSSPKEFPKASNITVTGQQVRSKGEVIIFNLLTSYQVPFQYEEALRLTTVEGQNVTAYPDFVITTAAGRKIYWEHVGLLEKENYYENFCSKIKLYHHNGITLGDNLIVTADKSGGAINSQYINQMTKHLILPEVRTFN